VSRDALTLHTELSAPPQKEPESKEETDNGLALGKDKEPGKPDHEEKGNGKDGEPRGNGNGKALGHEKEHGNGKALGHEKDHGNGKALGHEKDQGKPEEHKTSGESGTAKEHGNAEGSGKAGEPHGNNDCRGNGKGIGSEHGQGKGLPHGTSQTDNDERLTGRENALSNGQGNKYGLYKKAGPGIPGFNVKPKLEQTRYLYLGLSNLIHKEYSDKGSPYAEYYVGPGNEIVSRKMFGLHGLINPAKEPDLDTNGGLMYYAYNGRHTVSELTDRHGDIIESYRYDVFGGIFAGITAPYNTVGYTGQHYDDMTGLMDMKARWYDPTVGRFLTEDPWPGDLLSPWTQNRYAYVGNNPLRYWDPTGRTPQDYFWEEQTDTSYSYYAIDYTYKYTEYSDASLVGSYDDGRAIYETWEQSSTIITMWWNFGVSSRGSTTRKRVNNGLLPKTMALAGALIPKAARTRGRTSLPRRMWRMRTGKCCEVTALRRTPM
jgi:RHS repeat-associated protein